MKTEIMPNGEGTEENPYQITSLENLLWLRNEASKNNTYKKFYKMMNDIDALETKGWNDGAGFIPIGEEFWHAFTGTFDGNGKTITDLYINYTSKDVYVKYTNNFATPYVGLFGCTREATIKNLELKNVNISGIVNKDGCDHICVGGLVGQNLRGAITGCSVSGNVTVDAINSISVLIGGLVGYNDHGEIKKCTASGNVTDIRIIYAHAYVGNGLIGKNPDTSDSTYYGGCSTYYGGGLVGENFGGEITDCTASCKVTGTGAHDYTAIGQFVGNNGGIINTNTDTAQ